MQYSSTIAEKQCKISFCGCTNIDFFGTPLPVNKKKKVGDTSAAKKDSYKICSESDISTYDLIGSDLFAFMLLSINKGEGNAAFPSPPHLPPPNDRK
jgi:hypothetical protein